MSPPTEKPNLHTLPLELLGRTVSFLDSPSALSLATVHSGIRPAAEQRLWTSLNITLPPSYGQHPWDESLPYPPTFYPSVTRQATLRSRVQGILNALNSYPAKAALVRELSMEVGGHSAVEMIDLISSLAGQLGTLSLHSKLDHIRGQAGKRGTLEDVSDSQYFFDVLSTRIVSFDNLTNLTIKTHKSHLYLFNLQRILETCPNLARLAIKGGHRNLPSAPVGIIPPLPKLESLNICGTRLEPLEFIHDLLGQPNKLRHLRIADKGHVPYERGLGADIIPAFIPLAPLTSRLRECTTLKSLEWKFSAVSLGEVIRMEESPDGPFRNVEKVWMTSHIYAASLARLEIPSLANLRELYILPTPLGEGGGRPRIYRTPSHMAPDGFIPRVLNQLHKAPALEKIYLPDFETSSSVSPKVQRDIRDRHAGALIRSYTHPTYGELLIVRLRTRSMEFLGVASKPLPSSPSTRFARTAGAYVGGTRVGSAYMNQNSPAVMSHLSTLGVPHPRYVQVPRWLALQVNTMRHGATLGTAIVLANYGPTSTDPITFTATGSTASTANPSMTNGGSVSFASSVSSSSIQQTTTSAAASASLVTLPTQASPPPDQPNSNSHPVARSYSPPPTSSIGTHWNQNGTTVHHHMSNASPFNPHASAMAAVAALNARAAQAANNSRSLTGSESAATSTAINAGEGSTASAAHRSETTLAVPATSFSFPASAPTANPPISPLCATCPKNPALGSVQTTSFERTAADRLRLLPPFSAIADPSQMRSNAFILTPRNPVPASPTVIFSVSAAKLQYTPPASPLPPFTVADRTYDVPKAEVRSFVEWEWHWEEYALFNGRLLDPSTLSTWRSTVGLARDWSETGRGLQMPESAWRVLREWEEQQEAAWGVKEVQMRERRRAERVEEMAKLGREVKGKGRAAPVLDTSEINVATEPFSIPQKPNQSRGESPEIVGDGELENKMAGLTLSFALDEPGPSRWIDRLAL